MAWRCATGISGSDSTKGHLPDRQWRPASSSVGRRYAKTARSLHGEGGAHACKRARCCAACEKQCWGWLPHSQLEFGLAGPVELNVNHTLHLHMCGERHSSSVVSAPRLFCCQQGAAL